MSRPPILPVIALLGLASALAQEITAPPELNTTPATDSVPKATPKKMPAASEARKSSPPQTANVETVKPVAEGPANNAKPRRVTFVKKEKPAVDNGDQSERPRTFWERLFGLRKPKPAAPEPMTPEPVATPKATPRPKKIVKPSTPVPQETEPVSTPSTPKPRVNSGTPTKPAKVSETAAMEKPEKTSVSETPTVTTMPKASPTPRATPVPKKPKTATAPVTAPLATPARKLPVAPAADADPDAQEKYHYEVAKDKALQDAEVQKLKEKADGATTEEEARKAQRAYNKALFNKMRSIDGSIKDRADRIEAAIMKRLDAE